MIQHNIHIPDNFGSNQSTNFVKRFEVFNILISDVTNLDPAGNMSAKPEGTLNLNIGKYLTCPPYEISNICFRFDISSYNLTDLEVTDGCDLRIFNVTIFFP